MAGQERINSCEKVYCYDLLINSTKRDEKEIMIARGHAEWLESFWFPTQRRKHPSLVFSIEDKTKLRIQDAIGNGDFPIDEWNRSIYSAVKKICVEDLGSMDAIELKDSIPDEDKQGRGIQDLVALEKQLCVKVVFLENNHILLVGQKAKLEKKAFVIRNMLSHYHWRLTGKDVSR